MSEFALRFLGVGNANARSLGSSAAVLECEGSPLLLIDCGPDTLHTYLDRYGALPPALFITHAHLDHVAGLEGLFYRLATTQPPPEPPMLFVPVTLVPVLQRRLADYPNLLAEGGRNFWDVFRLIPVAERFWHRDLVFDCFPARHHDWLSAFGLALEGRFLYTGDTRPIPEVVNCFASHGEPIFHDCALSANPSHTGLAGHPRPVQGGTVAAHGLLPLRVRGGGGGHSPRGIPHCPAGGVLSPGAWLRVSLNPLGARASSPRVGETPALPGVNRLHGDQAGDAAGVQLLGPRRPS